MSRTKGPRASIAFRGEAGSSSPPRVTGGSVPLKSTVPISNRRAQSRSFVKDLRKLAVRVLPGWGPPETARALRFDLLGPEAHRRPVSPDVGQRWQRRRKYGVRGDHPCARVSSPVALKRA